MTSRCALDGQGSFSRGTRTLSDMSDSEPPFGICRCPSPAHIFLLFHYAQR